MPHRSSTTCNWDSIHYVTPGPTNTQGCLRKEEILHPQKHRLSSIKPYLIATPTYPPMDTISNVRTLECFKLVIYLFTQQLNKIKFKLIDITTLALNKYNFTSCRKVLEVWTPIYFLMSHKILHNFFSIHCETVTCQGTTHFEGACCARKAKAL